MKLKLTMLFMSMLLGSFFYQAMAQNITVSGKVKNKTSNEPLIGATVSVEGTATSSVTDGGGNFSLSVQKGATLLFTYTGMSAVRYKANNEGSIEIQMEETSKTMDELVVIGYGVIEQLPNRQRGESER